MSSSSRPLHPHHARGPRRVSALCEPLEDRRLLANPVVDPLINRTVFIDKSLILPLTASDADGDRLNWTVTSSNPAVSARVHSGNPFLRLTVAGFGVMEFQLLRDRAPVTVDTIMQLVNAGFYDGLKFHRVIPGFMIQGGDPLGLGTGGPGFEFDDEYHPDAIFTGRGQLAMAKSQDDTNGSQFFITDSSPRHLDFNHTIFGQIVRGMNLVQQIAAVPKRTGDADPDNDDMPVNDVIITKAEIVENRTDAVVTLKAAGAPTTSTITVTASDGKGGTHQRTFTVSTFADPENTPPVLAPLPDRFTPLNTPIIINVTGADLEKNPFGVQATFAVSHPDVDGAINGGKVTITPRNNFTGVVRVLVGVTSFTHDEFGNPIQIANPNHLRFFDTQTITVAVGDLFPIDLVPAGEPRVFLAGVFSPNDLPGTLDDFFGTIDWGDGFTATPAQIEPGQNGNFLIGGGHRYKSKGRRAVTITVYSAQAQLPLVFSGQIDVADLDAGPDASVAEGAPFTRTLSLGVPGGGWTVTANYGDGQGPKPVSLAANGSFTLNHAYPDQGNRTITLVASHADGIVLTDSLVLSVANALPTATPGGDTTGLMNQSRTLTLSASDPSSADTAARFAYRIDWKDGSIQTVPAGTTKATHAFKSPGAYKVEVRAIDKDGGVGPAAVRTITILPVSLEPDPADATRTSLRVLGTAANDTIRLLPDQKKVKVQLGKRVLGSFSPTGRIRVFGLGGNDSILADPKLNLPLELRGDAGNDLLTAGAAHDILVGGAGNDTLAGNKGRDLLIGGLNTDQLTGGDDDDVLIAGRTTLDETPGALAKILAEWTRSASYSQRVSKLRNGGGLNGKFTLNGPTLPGDPSPDSLTGSAGSDLYFLTTKRSQDKLLDRAGNESVFAG